MTDGESGNRTHLRHYEVLAQLADLLAGHHDTQWLLPALAEKMNSNLGFDFLVFSLYDPVSGGLRPHICQNSVLLQEIRELVETETPARVVVATQQPILIPNIAHDERFPDVMKILKLRGILSYGVFPVSTAERRIGALGFGSSRSASFSNDVRVFLGRVAKLMALAIDNSMVRAAFQQEQKRIEALLEVSRKLLSNLQIVDIFPAVAEFVQGVVKQDVSSLALYDEQSKKMHVQPLISESGSKVCGSGMSVPSSDFVLGPTFLHGEIRILHHKNMRAGKSAFLDQMLDLGVKSLCTVPLISRKGTLGTLNLASFSESGFVPQDKTFLAQVAAQIALALDSASAYREVQDLTERLKTEKIYREGEVVSTANFEEIIGDSPNLRRTLGHVQTVAPSEATVLILGRRAPGKN